MLFSSHDTNLIIEKVHDTGYHFEADFLTLDDCQLLLGEADNLIFEVGNHVDYPINKGAKNEVKQLHERVYLALDHPSIPITSQLCRNLSEAITGKQPGLTGWLSNEIGYQRYRNSKDWISPHRDRRSDKLFSVTFTLAGSAMVNIYSSEQEPPDYTQLTLADSFLTRPGTAMFLKAPGFGNGEQVIHEVCPPIDGERVILNLRMRPNILKQPKVRQ